MSAPTDGPRVHAPLSRLETNPWNSRSYGREIATCASCVLNCVNPCLTRLPTRSGTAFESFNVRCNECRHLGRVCIPFELTCRTHRRIALELQVDPNPNEAVVVAKKLLAVTAFCCRKCAQGSACTRVNRAMLAYDRYGLLLTEHESFVARTAPDLLPPSFRAFGCVNCVLDAVARDPFAPDDPTRTMLHGCCASSFCDPDGGHRNTAAGRGGSCAACAAKGAANPLCIRPACDEHKVRLVALFAASQRHDGPGAFFNAGHSARLSAEAVVAGAHNLIDSMSNCVTCSHENLIRAVHGLLTETVPDARIDRSAQAHDCWGVRIMARAQGVDPAAVTEADFRSWLDRVALSGHLLRKAFDYFSAPAARQSSLARPTPAHLTYA